MTTQHRIGIIGLGMAVTPHAKSLIDLADKAEVAYASSRTRQRRDAFAAQFPTFPVTDTLDAILDDPAVSVVFLLTPPNTHLDLVRRCAEAGKHILLEKPLEISTPRAFALVESCRRAGVRLGVVLQHRYRPAGIRLREILADGRLGQIAGCSVTCRVWRPQSYYDEPGRGEKDRDGGGVLITQAIHTLDLTLSLFGRANEVVSYWQTSSLHHMETEDIVCAAVHFVNGAIGTIDATTAAYPGFPERIEAICRNGTAIIEGSGLEVYYHDGSRDSLAADDGPGGTGADPMAFPHDHHRALINDFLDAVADDRDPPITGEEALNVHLLIDALLQASELQRPVIIPTG